jgi:F-type H+-transporting ATPase subunit delta
VAKDSLVAHNYAQALFNVAVSRGLTGDDAIREARQLRDTLLADPRYRTFLEGPQFRKETKQEIVEKALKGRTSEVFYYLVQMLIRHGRIEYFTEVLDEFVNLVLEQQGIVPGTVTTAVPLSEDEMRLLQERLEATQGRRFNLRFLVDADLIGGVRIKYGDTLLDSSIVSYLGELRQRLKSTRLAS